MPNRRVLIPAILVMTVLMCAGCSSSGDATDSLGDGESAGLTTSESNALAADCSWLSGSWVVKTTLVFIDNPVMEPAANQPGADWVCEVDGSMMYLVTDLHTYEGIVTCEDGTHWKYVASSTYTDEGGVVWTSAIEVTGVKNSEDSFVGEMLGEISSDTDGHLYSAQWNLDGSRMAD
ncbi:MAG: hypothetical protein Q7J82_01870 [Coriobacteriia bacterium]|nr:hypothetical protein [Coriobacteriia bacterium]